MRVREREREGERERIIRDMLETTDREIQVSKQSGWHHTPDQREDIHALVAVDDL